MCRNLCKFVFVVVIQYCLFLNVNKYYDKMQDRENDFLFYYFIFGKYVNFYLYQINLYIFGGNGDYMKYDKNCFGIYF